MTAPKKLTKYALLCYDTENIGDEIQSLSALRFLPTVDYYLNRDDLTSFQPQSNETVKIILNSWFMTPSIKDNKYHWPPTNPALDPLLISMHVSFYNDSREIFSTPESLAFLRNHAPVGARDTATQKFFESIDVPTFFSGCLTLTLQKDPSIKKQPYILAVDVNDKIYQKIKKQTSRPVIRLNTNHITTLPTSTKFKLAKLWLALYQSAHCVITPRLHAMLPCLSFGTPVIGLTGRDPERYSGLIELVNHYSESTFLKTKIDFDHPPKNPSTFLPIRKSLIKHCKNFTNYDSEQSFLRGTSLEQLLTDPELFSILLESVGYGYENEKFSQKSTQEVISLKQEIENLKGELALRTEELNDYKTAGVKLSAKLLKNASKNYLKKLAKPSNNSND